ncbi:hypothetical protein [Streptomyces sp. NBC_00239]|uniref:hypothetical protein n=1 Tax=Streptomyces sp. NBC_00239 TaxID=2903640 RepID=UPI002E2A1BD3|nr:hypothetical protein [Streptomyces sp. NBC_00239]
MNHMKRVLAAAALAGAALSMTGTAQAAEPRNENSSFLHPLHDGYHSEGDGMGSEQDYLDHLAGL